MRVEFEAAVGPQRTASPRRCCWDYWYVPGQFAYIRTFARGFFSPQLYRSFGTALSRWADVHLGCSAWTEPWLSYYIDGCRQELHSDVRHGPWAWVFSLTHWEQRRFSMSQPLPERQNPADTVVRIVATALASKVAAVGEMHLELRHSDHGNVPRRQFCHG